MTSRGLGRRARQGPEPATPQLCAVFTARPWDRFRGPDSHASPNDLALTLRIELLDLLSLHILSFMKDPDYFDHSITWIPEKQHVRWNGEAPKCRAQFRTGGSQFSWGLGKQLTLRSEPQHHFRRNRSPGGVHQMSRNLGQVPTGRPGEPSRPQAASERSALRISSNTSSAGFPSPRSSSSTPVSIRR